VLLLERIQLLVDDFLPAIEDHDAAGDALDIGHVVGGK